MRATSGLWGRERIRAADVVGKGRRQTEHCCRVAHAVVVAIHHAEPGFANARRVRQHGLEHRLQLAGRARDTLQNLGGRGLLLQRFGEILRALAQLLEQPCVLDRDHRLGGEIPHQLDLLFGEGTHLLAVDGDCADQIIVLEHRHDEQRPIACKLGTGDRHRIALDVASLCPDIGYVDDVLRHGGVPKAGARTGTDYWIAPPHIQPCLRRVVLGDETERVAFAQEEVAELGFANARRVRQHGLEHRLQLAG